MRPKGFHKILDIVDNLSLGNHIRVILKKILKITLPVQLMNIYCSIIEHYEKYLRSLQCNEKN